MEEILECEECGKFFSNEETIEKHAKRVHKTTKVIESRKGLFNL
jgi:uncharacterized C2H2 Zn-finger protein